MADGTQASADKAQERAARRGSQSDPANTPDEVRYTIEELKENPSLLGDGISAHAIAGALHDTERKTFTLGTAVKLVNQFLNRVPDTDDAETR